jgi:hypothetical protein
MESCLDIFSITKISENLIFTRKPHESVKSNLLYSWLPGIGRGYNILRVSMGKYFKIFFSIMIDQLSQNNFLIQCRIKFLKSWSPRAVEATIWKTILTCLFYVDSLKILLKYRYTPEKFKFI